MNSIWNKKNKKNNNRRRRPSRLQGYGLTQMGKYTGFDKPSINFLDPHRYVSLKYTDIFFVTVTTATAASQIFNLNSLFDPDRTGTGHQPYGFDQLAALYNRYRVLKCRWKIEFAAATASYNIVVVPVNGLLASSLTTLAGFTAAAESPRSKVGLIGAGGTSVIITGGLSINALNGVTLTEYLADDRFEAQVGTSPAEVITLYVGLYNPNAASVISNYSVELTYEVDMHDIIAVAQS